MAKKLTVLFTPLDGWGHINACRGLAEELRDRGHRVVFAIDKTFKDKLTPFGFEEIIHELPTTVDEENWAQFMERTCHILKEKPMNIAKKFFLPAAIKSFISVKEKEHIYEDILKKVKPNVIIIDHFICSPVLTNSGIPWVWIFSSAPPSCFYDERVPPAWSGLPLNGDKEEWRRYREEWTQSYGVIRDEISDYCVSKGAPKLDQSLRLHPISPYLNIYLYPQELDFKEIQPLAQNWIRVENFIRVTNETFLIPEEFNNRPGKLVFLSMGSIGCANLELMKRLTTILAKSEHKFIVSKGPLHDRYELPDNMWGKEFLPQTAVLPLVSLVITHGGNNTVTETIFYGKPMLVLPLFCDQYDNGQRIEETGLGLRLNPFHCSEEQLLSSVDRLLSDESLSERMTAIGHRIRNTNDKQVVSDRIEALCL